MLLCCTSASSRNMEFCRSGRVQQKSWKSFFPIGCFTHRLWYSLSGGETYNKTRIKLAGCAEYALACVYAPMLMASSAHWLMGGNRSISLHLQLRPLLPPPAENMERTRLVAISKSSCCPTPGKRAAHVLNLALKWLSLLRWRHDSQTCATNLSGFRQRSAYSE